MTVMTVGEGSRAAHAHVPTVLVIDHDERVRSSVRFAMNTIGFDIVEATTGTAGLEVVENGQSSVDVVLAELSPADSDGLDVATALGRLRPELPVVCMYEGTDDAAWDGAAPRRPAFLHKPISPSALRTMVIGALAEAALAHRPACGMRARAVASDRVRCELPVQQPV